MKSHQHFIVLCASAMVLLTGCGSETPSGETAPVEVKVMTARVTAVGNRQSFSGTIEEENGSSLSFPIAGTVKTVAVSEGQKVAKGQLIAVVDDASFKSSYNMAQAALDQATDVYNRMKTLHDNNSLPEVQWVEAESRLRQARSAFDIAGKNLADTRLYAPFSGYIAEKRVEVGNNVMPGEPAVKLVTVDNVKVSVSVPESEISGISLGDDVEIVVAALGGQSFTGKIKEKGVAANALSRSYEVKAEIRNPSNALLPGMLCSLYLSGSKAESSAILVPRHAVRLASDNRDFVWVNAGGKAIRKYVELGAFAGDRVAVASGLADGDQVVVEGQQKISDNMSVTVIK